MRIGTDLVRISRIAAELKRSPRFSALIYSSLELQLANSFSEQRRIQFLAGRFAIKEAVAKALSLRIGDGSILQSIESLPKKDGSPQLILKGLALEQAKRFGLKHHQVTLTHDGGFIIAFTVLD